MKGIFEMFLSKNIAKLCRTNFSNSKNLIILTAKKNQNSLVKFADTIPNSPQVFWVLLMLSSLSLSCTELRAESYGQRISYPATQIANQSGSNYHTLSPVIIPIVKTGKVYGYLRLEIQLATKDSTSIEPFKALYPALTDAYLSQLYSLIGDRWIPDQPLKQETILQILRNLTSKIIKEKTGSDNITVYLKNFFFTPANT